MITPETYRTEIQRFITEVRTWNFPRESVDRLVHDLEQELTVTGEPLMRIQLEKVLREYSSLRATDKNNKQAAMEETRLRSLLRCS